MGVLIVGAGPAGLACAIRLGQLLEESPETAARLGDVPVAVVEKGKAPGSHLLSGAVVNPRALRRLFRGRLTMNDVPSYGEVHGEAVYLLTKGAAIRIPPPPTMRNHGNWVVSVSQLSSLPRRAGGGGWCRGAAGDGRAEAARRRRSRAGDPHRRQGSRPRREASCHPRAGVGHRREADRPRRGDSGPPHRRRDLALRPRGRAAADLGARCEGGLEGAEAARAHRAHDGLAPPQELEVRRVRRLLHLPDGRRHGLARLRRRARVPRRRVLRPRRAAGVQDPQARAQDPSRRRADRLGREDDHRGRLPRAPDALQRAGPAAGGRERRPRQRPDAEGDPLRDRVRDHGRRGRVPLAPARRVTDAAWARSTRTTTSSARATS